MGFTPKKHIIENHRTITPTVAYAENNSVKYNICPADAVNFFKNFSTHLRGYIHKLLRGRYSICLADANISFYLPRMFIDIVTHIRGK